MPSNPLLLNGLQESQLFTTSLASDVQSSKGNLKVGVMSPTKKSLIADMIQVKYQAETVQVVTITTSSITPAGNTYYTIEFGDTNRSRGGVQEVLKRVSYLTPADVTTLGATAALQREAINLELVDLINEYTDSYYVTAASTLLGTGITVTDSAGYYPVNAQGMTNRLGASTVRTCRNSDGSGFVGTEASVTTAAVYSFGVGADLLAWKPVIDQMWGNLISGYVGGTAPKTAAGAYATSGQKYDGFAVVALAESPIATSVRAQTAYIPKVQIAYVDNGTGSSTANATGFAAFERAWILEATSTLFSEDASSIVFMNEYAPVCQGLGTGLPSGTAQAENVVHFGNGFAAHYSPIATSTIVSLVGANAGLTLELDQTNGEGVELSAPTWANSPKEFVVGKQEFSVYAKVTINDVSGLNPFWVGFRKKEAYNATFNSYSDFAVIGLGNATGDIFTNTEINGAGNTATDTTQNWADTETHTLEVRVDINGAVTFFLDGYKPTVTQTLTFDAGDSLIPTIYALQAADLGTPSLLAWAAVPSNTWRQ